MIPDPVFVAGVAGAFVALVAIVARLVAGPRRRRLAVAPVAFCPLCSLLGCEHWRSYLEAIAPELRP